MFTKLFLQKIYIKLLDTIVLYYHPGHLELLSIVKFHWWILTWIFDCRTLASNVQWNVTVYAEVKIWLSHCNLITFLRFLFQTLSGSARENVKRPFTFHFFNANITSWCSRNCFFRKYYTLFSFKNHRFWKLIVFMLLLIMVR